MRRKGKTKTNWRQSICGLCPEQLDLTLLLRQLYQLGVYYKKRAGKKARKCMNITKEWRRRLMGQVLIFIDTKQFIPNF